MREHEINKLPLSEINVPDFDILSKLEMEEPVIDDLPEQEINEPDFEILS